MAGRRSVARWRDWREWQDVHDGLFSSELYAQQRAISRVAAWRSRGDVSISVNATAQLVEIAVHERMADHQHHAVGVSARSHMELSLAYASAIVRCVNGLVDGSQKGTYAMAVSALAQRIGIPLWIVDLRHESTHNQLPSLPMLRFAASHLLAWLRSNYWYKQEAVIRSQVRQTADALLPRLPQLLKTKDAASASVLPPLKEVLDLEMLRVTVVPLLVDGFLCGERPFPAGILFRPEHLAQVDPARSFSEADALATYPKAELTALLLDLQSLWVHLSASLLSALCQKLIGIAQAPVDEANRAEVVVSLFWIKLLLSNEWRERLKYTDEPIEEIYRSGASMLVLATECGRRTETTHGELFEQVRAVLRACKGVRNHSSVTQAAAVRKQLGAMSQLEWIQLTEWSPSPLGLVNGFLRSEMEPPLDYPLDIDHETAVMYSSPRVDLDADEDDAIDQLMATLDSEYDASQTEMVALQRAVTEYVVQGSHHGSNQKVLPQQEVERIQNEIEIW